MLATILPPLIKAFYVIDLTNCKIFHVGFCTKSVGQAIPSLHMQMRLTGTR